MTAIVYKSYIDEFQYIKSRKILIKFTLVSKFSILARKKCYKHSLAFFFKCGLKNVKMCVSLISSTCLRDSTRHPVDPTITHLDYTKCIASFVWKYPSIFFSHAKTDNSASSSKLCANDVISMQINAMTDNF